MKGFEVKLYEEWLRTLDLFGRRLRGHLIALFNILAGKWKGRYQSLYSHDQ